MLTESTCSHRSTTIVCDNAKSRILKGQIDVGGRMSKSTTALSVARFNKNAVCPIDTENVIKYNVQKELGPNTVSCKMVLTLLRGHQVIIAISTQEWQITENVSSWNLHHVASLGTCSRPPPPSPHDK